MGGEYSVIGVPVHHLSETSTRAFVSTRLEVYTHHGHTTLLVSKIPVFYKWNAQHVLLHVVVEILLLCVILADRPTMCSTWREPLCQPGKQGPFFLPLSLIYSQVGPVSPLTSVKNLPPAACSYSPWAFSATLAYSLAGINSRLHGQQ